MTKRTVRKKPERHEFVSDPELIAIAFLYLIIAIWAAILFLDYLKDRWESNTDPQGLPALIYGKKEKDEKI